MSEDTEKLNSSVGSGSESQKSSSAGDVLKKPKSDINHHSSSGSPLKKPSSNSHHSNSISNGKPKDPNAIKKSSHDSSKLKDGSPKPRPKDGSHHSSSKHKDGSHSSPKPSSHSSSSKPKDGSHSSSKPKDGSHHSSSKPKHSSSSASSKPKEGSSSSSSKPKEGSSSSSKPSSSSSSKPKEGSSSSKPKDGSSSSSKPKDGSSSSSKPKDGSHHSSSKPKDASHHSSSKPKDGSHHSSSKPKDGSHSSSSKPKDGSHSSKPKDGSHSSSKHSSSSSSKPKDGSHGTPKVKSSSDSSKPKVSSSGDASKHSSSSSHKSSSHSSSKPKEGSSKHSSSSSKHSSSSSSKDKSKSDGIKKEGGDKVKVKTEPGSESKHSSSKSEKVKSESEHKVKTESEQKVKSETEQVKTEPESPIKVKKEVEADEDFEVKPEKRSRKRAASDDDDDYEPDVKPEKKKKVKEESKKRKKEEVEESDDDEPLVKKKKKDKKDKKKEKGEEEKGKKKKKKKAEEEQEVWKWWEEEPLPDGMKWRFLEHKGPMFAPPYEPLPDHIHFIYDGKKMKLSEPAEEVAGFYARMIEHDYTTKEVFNKNFFNDWRQEMTHEEQKTITKLEKCNFKKINQYYKDESEKRKNRTKEEKQALKKQNEEIAAEYGFCTMDNHREKIGNFRIEPPGLFRGRGEHPKMGKLKKRVRPEDVIINCAKDAEVPKAPEGHRWKKVIHDNKVSWLSTWTENVQGQNKYVMLNPSSRIKGEKDWQKYETARKLKTKIGKIRENYREDFKSKEMRVRQRAVAMYFIDKLALRAGNEKDDAEEADTVGCCSLRVEHISLHDEKDGKEFVVEFDFLGKDSIRYQNSVPVEKRVFKNLRLFVENKAPGDDLFDRLNTSILNQHLRDLMDNLTAKVFRTYNASFTLQNQLKELTNEEDSVVAKELAYNRANRAVAILCNHQRAAPKTFDKQMSNLQEKIEKKHDDIKKAKKEYKALKSDYKSSRNEKIRSALERKKKQVDRLEEQLMKLDVQKTDKQENKEIALGTSKLNYLDPRISVAWCKKYEVPIEKIYNKTQREKFRWAIDMAGAEFVF